MARPKNKDPENPNARKHFYNKALLARLAKALKKAHGDFDDKLFTALHQRLNELEMKARVFLIRDQLHKQLPQDYLKALAILMKSLEDDTLHGFDLWPYTEFIQTYGLNHFEPSMKALYHLTQRFTAEFAVRPFLIRYPEKTYAALFKWAHDPNEHVRRWASEGTRPRLPWGTRLQGAIDNPQDGLKILEKLKFDPELYVRKSVANHLNDISKDHPELVVTTLKKWAQQCPPESRTHLKWIQRHALRTLIKKGHVMALKEMGVHLKARVHCSKIHMQKKRYTLQEQLEFSFCLRSKEPNDCKLIVDYIIHFRTARGLSPKVFKLKAVTLKSRQSLQLTKKHPLKPITTRRYYPGLHRLEVQVNGRVMAKGTWQLSLPQK